VRVVLSGRWPVPLVCSRLESRSAELRGSLGAATTTSTIKRRCLCAVARSVFMCGVSGEWLFAAACACDLLKFGQTKPVLNCKRRITQITGSACLRQKGRVCVLKESVFAVTV